MKIEIAAALLMESIVRQAYSERRSSAIQPLQWSILRYLSTTNDVTRELKSICSYVGVTTAPVSRAVSTLEKKGMVTRGEHPTSKRSVLITITEKGLAALDDDPILKIAERIAQLNPRDQDAFINAIRQLMLEDSGLWELS